MKFIYAKWDDGFYKQLSSLEELQSIFNDLLIRLNGDAEQVLQVMQEGQRAGYLDPGLDLDRFREHLEERNIIASPQGRGAKLTPRGERHLRENAFQHIFEKMKPKGSGNHVAAAGSLSNATEILTEKKRFEHGDDIHLLDYHSSFFNAIRRSADLRLDLREDDLEVYQREAATGCATVLMIDISHSMILYGEDRITPAKQVAMAFTQLILSKYPKDDLNIVLFGDDAREVSIKELPYIAVGPYHTNTQAGLKMARQILQRKKQPNKQIFMITDGKPSMMKLPDGTFYKNSFGLDPKIISATLDEAIYCRKKGLIITTFMITQDPTLRKFVERLTELNQGRAFYSSVDNLGSFLLQNFVTNRKRYFY